MVYKAVYAIAHAIHSAACGTTNSTTECGSRITSQQVRTVVPNLLWLMTPF